MMDDKLRCHICAERGKKSDVEEGEIVSRIFCKLDHPVKSDCEDFKVRFDYFQESFYPDYGDQFDALNVVTFTSNTGMILLLSLAKGDPVSEDNERILQGDQKFLDDFEEECRIVLSFILNPDHSKYREHRVPASYCLYALGIFLKPTDPVDKIFEITGSIKRVLEACRNNSLRELAKSNPDDIKTALEFFKELSSFGLSKTDYLSRAKPFPPH